MQDKIKPLQDAEGMTDDALVSLTMASSALIITLESLEQENGVSPKKWQEHPAMAINFANRFPLYVDALYLILRSMQETRDSLQAVSKGIFEVRKQEGLQIKSQ